MTEYRDVHSSIKCFDNYSKAIQDSNMSDKQKGEIKKFILDLKLGKAGKKVKERRIINYLQFLIKIHRYIKKDVDKLTEKELTKIYQDIQENKLKRDNGMPYAQSSKDEFIKTLKRYLGWKWGKESLKYKKGISWMKEDYKKSDKNAITLQEAEKIVNKEPIIRNKCLFMFLFDSGARIEEALNTRIKDLILSSDKKYFKVHIRGQKTEESDRTIAIPLVTKQLNKWLKEHPTGEKEDYLFPLIYDNSRKIIRIMSERVLKYTLKPHELRHSSATHYIQYGGFGAQNIGGFYYRYGWKFGSKEALIYIKTYMYGGDIGQEKVVQFVENNKIEYLEKQLNEQQKQLDELKKNNNLYVDFIKKWKEDLPLLKEKMKDKK